MTKRALKKFALYSRERFIRDIKTRAKDFGITESGIVPLSGQDQCMALIEELKGKAKKRGYEDAYKGFIEDTACIWFLRLVTMRFLELNDYLPNGVRIFPPKDSTKKKTADILSSGEQGTESPNFMQGNINHGAYGDGHGEYQNRDKEEEAFRLHFLGLCGWLDQSLPILFENRYGSMDLFYTLSYFDSQGPARRLVCDIEEKYFRINSANAEGNVEIIGWLYQYFNTEVRNESIDVLAKLTIQKRDIPAATQVFTTDWVVKYMLDNSLGRYWIERNPHSPVRDSLIYLMPGEIQNISEEVSPMDIRVLDNAMGSGHCLSYAFDLLMRIYTSKGYDPSVASRMIIEKNLFGLDIDKKAYGLACFTLAVKARQYDGDVLWRRLEHNLSYFEDFGDIDIGHLDYFGPSMNLEERDRAKEEIILLIEKFENAMEIGSILSLDFVHKESLYRFLKDSKIRGDNSQSDRDMRTCKRRLLHLLRLYSILADKYHIMVTNPPYLNKPSKRLKSYINTHYSLCKGDLFSVFIFNNLRMCVDKGYSAFMSPLVWMFIKSHEGLRRHIIREKHIVSLIQMEYSAFREARVPLCSFVLQNKDPGSFGEYIRLADFPGGMEVQRIKVLEAIKIPDSPYFFKKNQGDFEKVPGMPIAYWIKEGLIDAFQRGEYAANLMEAKVGLQTGDNNRFLRLWYEVDINKLSFDPMTSKPSQSLSPKWFPYNKGGKKRQWYGNYDYLINWENDGEAIRGFKDDDGKVLSVIRNPGFYFKEAITWSLVTSGGFSIRYRKAGSIHDVSGMSAFSPDSKKLFYMLGLMGTKVANYIFKMLNPTINLQAGDFKNFPVLFAHEGEVIDLVKENVAIAKEEWNSYETAWGFKKHPFFEWGGEFINLEDSFDAWTKRAGKRFKRLKRNEERLNEIFIDLYGLGDQLSPNLADEEITLRKGDFKSDIKSFLSYGVGCILGRYSLDEAGIVFAGGQWDYTSYKKFSPLCDDIVQITDNDYSLEDITTKFVDFLRVSFGAENLERNLDFIAKALDRDRNSPKASRSVIRDYFLKDFFKDHIRVYSKRPIYWLIDSGGHNGFKALIYIHRYSEDLLGLIHNKYIPRTLETYRAYERKLEGEIKSTKGSKEKYRINKRIDDLVCKIKECEYLKGQLASLMNKEIFIDLDDGIRENYKKLSNILRPI